MKTFLRRKEVAPRIKRSVRTLERWAAEGVGPPCYMTGGVALYDEDEVDAWVRRSRVPMADPEHVGA